MLKPQPGDASWAGIDATEPILVSLVLKSKCGISATVKRLSLKNKPYFLKVFG